MRVVFTAVVLKFELRMGDELALRTKNHRFRLLGASGPVSVALNARVVDFLAVKIGSLGDGKSARLAVQRWLQSQIDRDPGAFISGLGASRADRSYNTQRMMQLALDEIVDPTLRRKLDAAMEKPQTAERDR